MRVRSVLALMFFLVFCGCSDSEFLRAATAPTTQTAEDEWRRYDDPRFSADERLAVRAATEAVLDPKQPRPGFDQTFRYDVSKHDGNWLVIVWHVYGYKDRKPQFVPGGHTGVTLDANLKVKAIMPGA